MAFIGCRLCNWSQDDFWSKEGYNPFRQDFIDWLKESLFKDRIDVDPCVGFVETEKANKDKKGTWIDGRTFVAHELERLAKSIRNMVLPTDEDWQKVKNTISCPRCGKRDGLTID